MDGTPKKFVIVTFSKSGSAYFVNKQTKYQKDKKKRVLVEEASLCLFTDGTFDKKGRYSKDWRE